MMTDNEIIKALENCITIGERCEDCPFCEYTDCNTRLKECFHDLIKRKDSEIERLRHEYSNAVLTIKSKDSFIEYLKEYAKERKIEEIENRGIKKFSRRLQGELKKRRKMSNSLTEKTMIGYFLIDIDNLVKEMTENITKIEHNSLCEAETYKGGEQ